MSYHVFFGFSTGLAKPIRVPAGTKKGIIEHVSEVEQTLGLVPTQYKDNPKWTRKYYTARMESLYEVMRGRESEGVTFDEKPLTPRQAAQVINIFSTFIDGYDCRLDVPKDRDYLASSYDGGYDWCDKRGCPIRAEREE